MGVTAVLAGLTAAVGIGSTLMGMKANHDQKKALKTAQQTAAATPTYNADKEKKKAAIQEANANRARALSETDTIQTTALGNVGTTETKKKTLLGG